MLSHISFSHNYVGVREQLTFSWLLLVSNPLSLFLQFSLFHFTINLMEYVLQPAYIILLYLLLVHLYTS